MRYEGKIVRWSYGDRRGVVLAHYDGHCLIKVLSPGGVRDKVRVRDGNLEVEHCEDLAEYVRETVERLNRDQLRKLVRFLNTEVL